MTMEKILRQIEEIKELAQMVIIDLQGVGRDKTDLYKIKDICEDIEIEHKIEERLKNEASN